MRSTKFFNFPPLFVKVIENYLKDNLSCIILDDNTLTEFFKIEKGTWHRNPLSCLIFILIIEILLVKLNKSPSLSSLDLTLFNKIRLDERTLGFADNLKCFINDNEHDLNSLKNILHDFESVSNLKLNEKKTKLIPLGFSIDLRDELKLCIENLGFVICEKEIKILGIPSLHQ